MIDYLDEVIISRSVIDGMWSVVAFNKHYEGKELVDTLWEAMKDEI